MEQFIPLLLIGAFFYIALIRPQQRKAKDQATLLDSLTEGDEVLTVSGIYGLILEVEDNAIWLDVAEGVELKMARSAVQTIISRDGEPLDEPAAAEEFPGQRLLQKGRRKRGATPEPDASSDDAADQAADMDEGNA